MRLLATVLTSALLVTACSGQRTAVPPLPEPPAEPPAPVVSVFPEPPGLEPQVTFWRRVFSEWSQGQAVLHDNRHLQLVYAVLELPGPLSDHYTATQREYVRTQRLALGAELEELERRLAAGLPLDERLRQLADVIEHNAGPAALNGAAERLRSQRGLRERFQRGLAISGRYLPTFRAVFHEAGLPEDLAFLPHVESSFQAHARSSAGAVGMWQFTRGAAEMFMLYHPALDERLDPVASARGAARYLTHAYDRLGDWALAVTSYNHGINGMRRARDRYGNDFMRIVYEYDHPLFGFASRNFYAEFLAARQVALNPEYYFPEGIAYLPALVRDSLVLAESLPVSRLALQLGLPVSSLTALNPAWTESALSDRIALPVGTTVWLPPGHRTLVRRADHRQELLGRHGAVLTDHIE